MTVCCAENGVEAMERAGDERNEIGLIVSDMNMPLISGLELFQEMREQGNADALRAAHRRRPGADSSRGTRAVRGAGQGCGVRRGIAGLGGTDSGAGERQLERLGAPNACRCVKFTVVVVVVVID